MALVVAGLLRILGLAEYAMIVLVETVFAVVVGPGWEHIVAEAQTAWGTVAFQVLPNALVETEQDTYSDRAGMSSNWYFPQTIANSHIPVVERHEKDIAMPGRTSMRGYSRMDCILPY